MLMIHAFSISVVLAVIAINAPNKNFPELYVTGFAKRGLIRAIINV